MPALHWPGQAGPCRPDSFSRPRFPHLQISAGAMLPITAVQFGMNRALEQTYRRVTGADKLTTGGTVAVALGAGAASAFLGCPAE